MSKLADKIRKATRMTPQPLGFGSSKNASEATLVLAALTADESASGDLVRAGADVVVAGSPASPATVPAAKQEGAVRGAWIAGASENEATKFREAGYDFVVFDPDRAGAGALLDTEIGYVMRLPVELSDNEIRALESFQLDAIDVGAIARPMTVRQQIGLRRVFGMTRKPLMVTVDAAISSSELQALRDTNVVVVAVEGREDVERLRKTIDALPPRARRKDADDRPTPLVPRTSAAAEEEEPDEE